MFCRKCGGIDDVHERGCVFSSVAGLLDVLASHQWEFNSRYFCTCGEAIHYDSPYTADRAMANHQLDVAERSDIPIPPVTLTPTLE